MIEDRDEVRELRDALQAGTANPTDGSEVASDRIWAAANGELSPEQLSATADAAVESPGGVLEWQLARELSRAEEAREAAPSPLSFPERRARLRPPRWLAAAAVLLLAVGLGVWLRTPSGDSGEGRGTTVYRGEEATVVSTTPKILPRSRFLITWEGPEGATYSVEVTRGLAETVALVDGLQKRQHLIPEASLRGVESGAEILCQIRADLPDGQREKVTFVVELE